MDPITLLVLIVIIGLVVFLIDRYIPMAEPFKTIFRVVLVIIICLFLLNMIGIHVPYLKFGGK
jgi:hypothetical protein